jgi:hypothetical protein
MAQPYDHYGYSAANATDFDAHPHTAHIPEDEGFNPAFIPDASKPYAGAYDDTSPNKFSEEEGYPLRAEQLGHKPHGDLEASDESLVRNAADVGRNNFQDFGASLCTPHPVVPQS